jgi:ABC-type sulfate transport system permease component
LRRTAISSRKDRLLAGLLAALVVVVFSTVIALVIVLHDADIHAIASR